MHEQRIHSGKKDFKMKIKNTFFVLLVGIVSVLFFIALNLFNRFSEGNPDLTQIKLQFRNNVDKKNK